MAPVFSFSVAMPRWNVEVSAQRLLGPCICNHAPLGRRG
jgi:hypothetical protein